MSKQTEALRLAEIMEQKAKGQKNRVGDYWGDAFCDTATAELRRLHAENLLLRQRHRDDNVEYTLVLAQRDALLEALKEIVAMWDHRCYAHGDGVPTPLHAKARAAIAKAEENT